jgi:hypothetical protein
MRITLGKVLTSMAMLALVGAIGFFLYGRVGAEDRVRAICASIKPGMTFTELVEFSKRHNLLVPRQERPLMYLAERRSFGRHACKVAVAQGRVVKSEHDYAD